MVEAPLDNPSYGKVASCKVLLFLSKTNMTLCHAHLHIKDLLFAPNSRLKYLFLSLFSTNVLKLVIFRTFAWNSIVLEAAKV